MIWKRNFTTTRREVLGRIFPACFSVLVYCALCRSTFHLPFKVFDM